MHNKIYSELGSHWPHHESVRGTFLMNFLQLHINDCVEQLTETVERKEKKLLRMNDCLFTQFLFSFVLCFDDI